MSSQERIDSMRSTTNSIRAFRDGMSGIPTIVDDVLGRKVRDFDAEQLSGKLADQLDLPEDYVNHDQAANTLLAVTRQQWTEASSEAQALIISFSQRVLEQFGLEVVRKDG